MFYYRFDGAAGSGLFFHPLRLEKVNGGTIIPVQMWVVAGVTSPGYKSLQSQVSSIFYTTYLGIIRVIDINTGAIGISINPQPPSGTFTTLTWQFDSQGTMHYYKSDGTDILNPLYTWDSATGNTSFILVTFPLLLKPIISAWWGRLNSFLKSIE
jgi:hypothetical protein